MRREGLLMEDVQDGIKISIQDGVMEDPTVIPTGRGISCISKSFVAQPIGNPTIQTILNTHFATSANVCTITTILETSVV